MRVSVLIPAFNAAATIRETLASVFAQTVAPHEVLVLDDGSTDDTAAILNSYGSRISILHGDHKGPAEARNRLCTYAKGDQLAFLDADDIWHPQYLESQLELWQRYPRAAIIFSGHVNFTDSVSLQWPAIPSGPVQPSILGPVDFIRSYHHATGRFGSMSFCSVSRAMLAKVGGRPFKGQIAEDCYFFHKVLFHGDVLYCPTPRVAYRIRENSTSANQLLSYQWKVRAFENLEAYYRSHAGTPLWQAFHSAFISTRRVYARILIGAGRTRDAREQLKRCLGGSFSLTAHAKAGIVLLSTYFPATRQPRSVAVRRS